MKRRSTITEGPAKRKPVKIGLAGGKGKRKQADQDKIEELDGEHQADDEGANDKTKASDLKEEDKDKVGELDGHGEGQVIHKKRRKKNVESRDVSTQTERSDYMLIKQRQLDKQR